MQVSISMDVSYAIHNRAAPIEAKRCEDAQYAFTELHLTEVLCEIQTCSSFVCYAILMFCEATYVGPCKVCPTFIYHGNLLSTLALLVMALAVNLQSLPLNVGPRC